MKRRSPFIDAAKEWFLKQEQRDAIATSEFWERFSKDYPDLTATSETRKTPRWTCMRDLRSDPGFEVRRGTVRLLSDV